MTAVPARVNVTHPPDVMTVADGIEGVERVPFTAEKHLRDAGTAPPPPPLPTPLRTVTTPVPRVRATFLRALPTATNPR